MLIATISRTGLCWVSVTRSSMSGRDESQLVVVTAKLVNIPSLTA